MTSPILILVNKAKRGGGPFPPSKTEQRHNCPYGGTWQPLRWTAVAGAVLPLPRWGEVGPCAGVTMQVPAGTPIHVPFVVVGILCLLPRVIVV